MKLLRRNRFVPTLTAMALLLQVMLPFFATYQVPARANTGSLTSLYGEKILICTGNGLRFVNLQDLLNGKAKQQPDKKYKCPLCYVAVHGKCVGTAPALAALAPPEAPATTIYPAARTPVARDLAWQRLRTRSPPAAVTA